MIEIISAFLLFFALAVFITCSRSERDELVVEGVIGGRTWQENILVVIAFSLGDFMSNTALSFDFDTVQYFAIMIRFKKVLLRICTLGIRRRSILKELPVTPPSRMFLVKVKVQSESMYGNPG
jgi:hypothetical protein